MLMIDARSARFVIDKAQIRLVIRLVFDFTRVLVLWPLGHCGILLKWLAISPGLTSPAIYSLCPDFPVNPTYLLDSIFDGRLHKVTRLAPGGLEA
jgi:hypothetical protein